MLPDDMKAEREAKYLLKLRVQLDRLEEEQDELIRAGLLPCVWRETAIKAMRKRLDDGGSFLSDIELRMAMRNLERYADGVDRGAS